MQYKKYIPLLLTLFIFGFSFLLTSSTVEASCGRGETRINGKCVHFSSSGCGNMNVNGTHVGHAVGMCLVYGICGGGPTTPPPPTCTVTNQCIGKNIITHNSDCSYTTSATCPIGCNSNATCKDKCPNGSPIPPSGVCPNNLCPDGTLIPASGVCPNSLCPDGTARPANGICPGNSCINGSSCVSVANACGMTNGKKDCASNLCVAPSDSLCANSCTGPDGVTIQNGETRNYFTGSCAVSSRLCLGGTLQGDSAATNASCGSGGTGSSGAGGGAGGAAGSGLPIITTFTATPSDVNKGQSCTLAWTTSAATNCKIVGPNLPTAGVNATLPNGNKMTPPITATSPYTLSCSNAGGSIQKIVGCRLNPLELEK